MFRFAAVAAALLMFVSAAAAGTLDRVRESGVLKIGYRLDAQPFSFKSKLGEALSIRYGEKASELTGPGKPVICEGPNPPPFVCHNRNVAFSPAVASTCSLGEIARS